MKNSETAIEPRQRAGETEKMTAAVGLVDLGHVDLLVHEGHDSNRSDLVRTALRSQLALHTDVLKRTVVRRTLTVGLQHGGRAAVESVTVLGAFQASPVVRRALSDRIR